MLDIALSFDATARSCDLVVAGGDFALDATPATPMLLSLLTDRYARADDALPSGPAELLTPASLNPRRGWCGDALDPSGQRIGSRLWLLVREKQTDTVRLRAEAYAAEALAWLGAEGLAVSTEAEWVSRGVLGLRARAGSAEFVVRL